jgi:hypothetical protein
VGRVSRTAVVAWTLVTLGGCASITGLGDITEQNCAPNCDGGNDVTVGEGGEESGSSSGVSGSSSGSGGETGSSSGSSGSSSGVSGSSSGSSGGSSGSSGSSSGSSGGSSGSASSSGSSSGGMMEAGPDAPPFDSGCGPLNVPTNCGACNQACTATNANSATCSGQVDGTGAVCGYACKANFLDCNKINPPNLDGCECPYSGVTTAPNCCAEACPTKHTDGLVNQTYYPPSPYFYDCVLPATMNSQLAQDACNAYVVGRGGAANYCLQFGPSDGGPPDSWCAATCTNPTTCTGFMNDCICWTFSGTYQGTVLDPQALGIPMPQMCYTGGSSGTFN